LTVLRYITIHDDRIPYPIKELTFAVEDDTVYTYACMRLAETLLKIDEMIAEPEKAEEIFREQN